MIRILSTQMNEQQAVMFTARILEVKDLLDKLPCQLTTLFRENRRSEHTAYTDKHGTKKGNRNNYGFLPFHIEKRTAYYQRIDLINWVTATLIPKLEAAT